MGFSDLFSWRARAMRNRLARVGMAPFVMTIEGEMYSDASGRATDIVLARGAREVLGAGRIAVEQGQLLEITNESPKYHPCFDQMLRLVERLAAMGLDLKGDGKGVVVIVYATIDENGLGKRGTRYRVSHSSAGVKLIPE